VERIAAVGDRTALAELDARHGMTLYAIAYTALLNSDAADTVVAAVLREVWRGAASFSALQGSVRRWLGDLARRAARDHRGQSTTQHHRAVARRPVAAPPPRAGRTPEPPRRRGARLTRLARLVALGIPVLVLALLG